METGRFLLIKSTGNGFWYDMHHVLTQLYFAEITKRIPVIYWGKNCMYSIDENLDTFEQFFQPVSEYTIEDISNPDFTYFPSVWRHDNLREENLCHNMDVSLEAMVNSRASVVVQDTFMEAGDMMHCIEKYPFYGYIARYLYSSMLKKYIRLQPLVLDEISEFYNSYMRGRKVIAAHIRGSDKIIEVAGLPVLNRRYPEEIAKLLELYPDARLFLMTDCRDILSLYRELYPGIVISTECGRVLTDGPGAHFQEYEHRARKGLEIIKDTWLAAKCDYFIGNGYSNVSMAVSELADWDTGRLKLLY
ncbi:hypothetical protein CLHUN_37060 [Ruminiclostridium hungatei]|uniref:GDP-fucose protein O-fucosyltransferase n=1 Tax=Ruminiclostridium hungatei TaxID=48256 RepID=A0A1V4SET6_RUMHU|nr:hypothetical protein [Ruminiclostridium hungatei]OPX42409.1 hypothetical protein CLHUN_37060 [Ruminiclostridium hungatei]